LPTMVTVLPKADPPSGRPADAQSHNFKKSNSK